MSHNVFSNTSQVSGKAGSNKSIARFPDVCMSPPSPPAGPIPIPYPDTSMSSDLKKGSKTVKVGGKPACLAQQSHYKPSALGNEAATKSFGASVITHVITGKTVFQSWSMDVKFEGKNVCRHIDLTTSNHNCPPPATPPLPTAEGMNVAAGKSAEDPVCPCCKKKDCAAALPSMAATAAGGEVARPNISHAEWFQLDPASPQYETVGKSRQAQMDALPCEGGNCVYADSPDRKSDPPCDTFRVTTPAEKDELTKSKNYPKERLRDAHGIPKSKGRLAKWMASAGNVARLPAGGKAGYDAAAAMPETTPKEKADKATALNKMVQLDHTTPRAAGGCPQSTDNTQPHIMKCGNCKEVDGLVDTWNNEELTSRRAAMGLV